MRAFKGTQTQYHAKCHVSLPRSILAWICLLVLDKDFVHLGLLPVCVWWCYGVIGFPFTGKLHKFTELQVWHRLTGCKFFHYSGSCKMFLIIPFSVLLPKRVPTPRGNNQSFSSILPCSDGTAGRDRAKGISQKGITHLSLSEFQMGCSN